MRNGHQLDFGRRRGMAFTVLEALIASAILAVLTAAVSGALIAGRQQSRYARDMLAASFLGQALMDEVARLPYATAKSGAVTRATYANAFDYDGYTDGVGTAKTSITDVAGNAYGATYQLFTRVVAAQSISSSPPGWNQTLVGQLFIVTVSTDGRELIRLHRVVWR